MKLYFKRRLFSWFDSFDIFDEEGNTVYTVEGKLAWGHKLVIYGKGGQEIARVEQVVLTWLPKFELYIGGQLAGTLRKELTFLRPKYDIDFNGWSIEGDWMEWDYQIWDDRDNQVAAISKELWHLSDHYVIDVRRPEDALDALMVVLAIDAEKCSRD